jgi:uncharacterized protein (DUF1778 family)
VVYEVARTDSVDMPRRKRAQEQVNVRLDAEMLAILEAAAFVEHASVTELVRPAVEGLARRYGNDHAVQLALEARDAREADLASGIAQGEEADTE